MGAKTRQTFHFFFSFLSPFLLLCLFSFFLLISIQKCFCPTINWSFAVWRVFHGVVMAVGSPASEMKIKSPMYILYTAGHVEGLFTCNSLLFLLFLSEGHGQPSRPSCSGAAGPQTSACRSPSAPCSTSWWTPGASQPSCVPWTWVRR